VRPTAPPLASELSPSPLRAMAGSEMRLGVAGILFGFARAAVETHYGIVFDAGSSGSRIHVYSWKTGGGGPKDQFDLIEDDLLKIKPGLSAYKATPSEAGASLRPLLEHAKAKIPAEVVSKTPAFLMATAGLRLVGEAAKDAILASVCEELKASGFIFKCEWATLLDGQDEGLYGWVTVNYLLDRLYPPPTKPAVGIIDLGGGSVQIVFDTDAAAPAGMTHKALDFGGRQHSAYVKSHLGFGLDEARKSVLEQLLTRHEARGVERPLKHPCLPSGATMTYKEVEMVGDGDWGRCAKLVSKLFPHTPCPYSSCSFGGAYQPPLPAGFYGFSYMYDRTAAIGLLDQTPKVFGSQEMSRADIAAAGAAVCALNAAQTAERFKTTQDAAKSNNYCGDVAYIAVLLEALGFDLSTKLTMTNKIKDVELVWTLGAMLAKSAELASGVGSSWRGLALLAVVAAAGVALCRRLQAKRGYVAVNRSERD